MIDVSKAQWDLSKEEQYFIRWLEENGFSGTLDKQYVSKTKFTVTKDGVTDHPELTQGIKNMNIKSYCENYARQFAILCNLEKLKRQKAEQS